MPLSRRDYAKANADQKRSEAAQKGAWKRTINERRIDALDLKNRKLVEAVRKLGAMGPGATEL